MCQPACAVSGRDALEANPQKHKGSEEEGVHGHGHGSSDGGVDEVDNLHTCADPSARRRTRSAALLAPSPCISQRISAESPHPSTVSSES
eukprot:3935177-Rhodomonas_salina.2